ncbi:MAG: hypothetical protein SGARI_000562 [Bacillariaceae sp.]
MTVAIQLMSDEEARANGQFENRELRVMELYKLCMSLTDTTVHGEVLEAPALAVCDLITMACLHNLVHLEFALQQEDEEDCAEDDHTSAVWIGNLLLALSENQCSSRYPDHPELAERMQEVCHRFLMQAFALFGGAAAAA